MAGRKPAEAVKAFADPIQRAVSAVLNAYVNVGQGYHPGTRHVLFFNDGGPIEARGTRPLLINITHQYKIVEWLDDDDRGPWKVATAGWAYHVGDTDGDLIGYHWHPWDVPFPHVHTYFAKRLKASQWAEMHFPTGRISIEEFFRLLVREFGLVPHTDNWDDVLGETEAAYRRWRTWQ
jgi:hypothetical protein